MAVFKCVLLCVGFFAGITLCFGAQRYGRCNDTYFLTKSFSCERQFFKALASNNETRNCSELYKSEIFECYNHTLVSCYYGQHESWRSIVEIALHMLEAFNWAKLFCGSKANMKKELAPEMRKHFPCKDEYFEKGEICTEKFMLMLNANRMDPYLCKAFDEAVNCTFIVSKLYCTKHLELPEDVELENPFCTKERLALLPTTTAHLYTSRDSIGDGNTDRKHSKSTVNVQAYSPAVQLGTNAHAWVIISTVLIGYLL